MKYLPEEALKSAAEEGEVELLTTAGRCIGIVGDSSALFMIALIEELTFDKAEADKVKAMAHAERRYSTGKGFYYPGFEVERAGFDDGDYVTHVDCESLRPNRCEVLGKTSDGRYEIECPGPEGVGTETLIANRNELRAY